MPFIEIFSGPQCSYCAKAKALLQQRGLAYQEYDVAATAENLQEFQRRLPRVKSIPQIFIDHEYIGSYDDLVLMAANGQLPTL